MICPSCGTDYQLRTIDSRQITETVWRRKKCLCCGRRFTTIEIIIPEKTNPAKYHQEITEIINSKGSKNENV